MKILTSKLTGKYIKDKSKSVGEAMYTPFKGSFSRESPIEEISPMGLTSKGNYSVAIYNGERLKNESILAYTDTLVYDFDSTLFLEALEEKLDGYKYVIATSASHKTKGDRYRVFLELDEVYGSDELELYPIIKELVIDEELGLGEYADKAVSKSATGWVFRSLSDLEYHSKEGKQINLNKYKEKARRVLQDKEREKEKRIQNRIATIGSGVFANDIEVTLLDGSILRLSETEGANESCVCPTCNRGEAYIFRDEITDLQIIKCRREKNCGATYKLREEPKIDWGKAEEVDYRKYPINNVPVSTEIMQQSLERTWTTVPYGHYPSKFREAHIVLASALNDVVMKNREGKGGGRVIIPEPTGSGKTTGTAHYVAEYAKVTPIDKLGVVIVTKFIDEGVELAKQINLLLQGHNGIEAVAINSQMETPIMPKDYRLHPIIVITHKNFENKVKEVRDFATHTHLIRREEQGLGVRFNRELLIIDEALSMIEEHSVSTDKLEEFTNEMYSLKRHYSIPDEVQKEIDFVEELKNDLMRIKDEVQGREYKEKTVPLSLSSTALGISDFGEEQPLLDKLKKFITSKEIEPHKVANLKRANKEAKRLKDSELRSDWANRIEEIERAFVQTDYADLDTYGNLNLWSVRDIFPNGVSYAVLDATGDLDYTLKLSDEDTLIEGFEDLRDYSNFTLYAVRINTGKNTLDKIPDLVPKFYSYTKKIAEANGLEDSPFILASYKKYKQQIDSIVGENTEKLRQAHFGNITGKNLWKDCKVGMYLGQYRKPQWFNRNRVSSVIGAEEMIEQKEHTINYGTMNVIQDFIQALNRQNIRVVNDMYGGCAKNVAVCTIDNNEFGDTIIAVLKKVMKGINIVDVDKSELDLVEPAKYVGKNVELVIETLQRCIPTSQGSLSIKDMRQEAGLTEKNWEKLKKGENFEANLLKAGYALTEVEGKRHKQFKKVRLAEDEESE